MCDRQYLCEYLGQLSCPDQPVCDICWRLIMDTRKFETNQYIDSVVRAIPAFMAIKRPVKANVAQVDMHGATSLYELTLTTTKDDPYELRQFLQKIVDSRMFEVVYYQACLELQANGNPHIHAMLYSSKKYLDATKIKSNKGIKYPYRFELKRVRHPQAFLDYLIKERLNISHIEYCQRKGIPQFWDKNGVQGQEEVRPQVNVPQEIL